MLPEARRQGIGTALLRELAAHLATLDFVSMSSHVDGADPGSLAFALRHGFEEVDRQVEQVKVIGSRGGGSCLPRGSVRHAWPSVPSSCG